MFEGGIRRVGQGRKKRKVVSKLSQGFGGGLGAAPAAQSRPAAAAGAAGQSVSLTKNPWEEDHLPPGFAPRGILRGGSSSVNGLLGPPPPPGRRGDLPEGGAPDQWKLGVNTDCPRQVLFSTPVRRGLTGPSYKGGTRNTPLRDPPPPLGSSPADLHGRGEGPATRGPPPPLAHHPEIAGSCGSSPVTRNHSSSDVQLGSRSSFDLREHVSSSVRSTMFGGNHTATVRCSGGDHTSAETTRRSGGDHTSATAQEVWSGMGSISYRRDLVISCSAGLAGRGEIFSRSSSSGDGRIYGKFEMTAVVSNIPRPMIPPSGPKPTGSSR